MRNNEELEVETWMLRYALPFVVMVLLGLGMLISESGDSLTEMMQPPADPTATPLPNLTPVFTPAPANPSEVICIPGPEFSYSWTWKVTGIQGNRWEVYQQFLMQHTIEWEVFRDRVVQHNLSLRDETEFYFYPDREYVLPMRCSS